MSYFNELIYVLNALPYAMGVPHAQSTHIDQNIPGQASKSNTQDEALVEKF